MKGTIKFTLRKRRTCLSVGGFLPISLERGGWSGENSDLTKSRSLKGLGKQLHYII